MIRIKNDHFSNLSIISTIVATWFSSEFFICYIQQSYIDGIPFMIAEIGNFLQLILIGYFFSNKIHNYKGLSLGELIENNYGKLVSKIVLNCGLVYSIAFVSMEFSILKSIIQEYFDINTFIVISGALVIFSSIGGLKSIIFSDVVYLVFFSAMIILLLLVAINYIDLENLKLIIDTDKRFSFESSVDNHLGKTMSLFAIFLIPCFDPAIFQRLSICKNSSQVRVCFVASGVCFFVIQAILSFVALFLISKEFFLKSDIDSGGLITYLFDNYLNNDFLKFIIIAGIVAIIFSTVNSYINAGFVNSGTDNYGLFPKLRGILLGFISIIIALKYQNLFQILMLGTSFYLPIATPAIIAFLIRVKDVGQGTVLIGMVLGAGATLLAHFILDEDAWAISQIPILIGFCANSGFIFLTSILFSLNFFQKSST